MRKFLAVILAVLTLVSIVLPVSAADITAADGTTADDAKNLSLIVTEYMSDTMANEVGPIQGGDTTTVNYNAYSYIEIYNSGDVAVDLYKVAIGVSSNDVDANGNKYWSDLHQFTKKMSLRSGSIYQGVSFNGDQASLSANKAENSINAVLEPGKTAVIWFWNDYTTKIAAKMQKSPGEAVNGVYHKGFKDFYGMNNDDLVVAVYAGTDANGAQSMSPISVGGRFLLNTSSWVTYGLIDEMGMGANGWTVDTPAWTVDNGYNERVIALFGWGTGTHHGLFAAEGYATVYVPANVAPDLYNRYQQMLGLYPDFVPATDYVVSDYVDGYKELAIADFRQYPTPGTVPAWQLAYIAASKGEAYNAATINAFISATAVTLENIPTRTETKIEVQLIPREETSD